MATVSVTSTDVCRIRVTITLTVLFLLLFELLVRGRRDRRRWIRASFVGSNFSVSNFVCRSHSRATSAARACGQVGGHGVSLDSRPVGSRVILRFRHRVHPAAGVAPDDDVPWDNEAGPRFGLGHRARISVSRSGASRGGPVVASRQSGTSDWFFLGGVFGCGQCCRWFRCPKQRGT